MSLDELINEHLIEEAEKEREELRKRWERTKKSMITLREFSV